MLAHRHGNTPPSGKAAHALSASLVGPGPADAEARDTEGGVVEVGA